MMGPPKSGRLFLKTHGDCFLHATAGWLSYASFNLTEERLAIVRVTLPNGQTFYTTLCPTAISYQSVKRGVSREKYLEIDPYFARELGVEYDTQVVVEAVPSVERCAALYLTPKNPDDYETLIESQEKIEYELLDRTRVVSASLSFPIWIDKTVIPARVVRSEPSASWVLMVQNTRLYIESSAVTSPGATSSIGSLSTPGHSSSQGSGESPDSEESSSNSTLASSLNRFTASFSYMKSLFQQPHPLQHISPDYSAPDTPERKTLPKRHTTTPEPATSSRPHTVGTISPGGGNPSQGKHSRMSSWHAGTNYTKEEPDPKDQPISFLPPYSETPKMNACLRIQPHPFSGVHSSQTPKEKWNHERIFNIFVHPSSLPEVYWYLKTLKKSKSLLVEVRPMVSPLAAAVAAQKQAALSKDGSSPATSDTRSEFTDDSLDDTPSTSGTRSLIDISELAGTPVSPLPHGESSIAASVDFCESLVARLCFATRVKCSSSGGQITEEIDGIDTDISVHKVDTASEPEMEVQVKTGHVLVSDPLRQQLKLGVCSWVKLLRVKEQWRMSLTNKPSVIVQLQPLDPQQGSLELVTLFKDWVSKTSKYGAALVDGQVLPLLSEKDGWIYCRVSLNPRPQKRHIVYCFVRLSDIRNNFIKVTWEQKSSKSPKALLPDIIKLDPPAISENWNNFGALDKLQAEGLRYLTSVLADSRAMGALLVCGQAGSGGPGCGKSSLARLLCKAVTQFPHYAYLTTMDCTTLRGQTVSMAKRRLRQVFMEAEWHQPSVVLLDNLDHAVPHFADVQEEVMGEGALSTRRAQVLLDLMSEFRRKAARVVVIATATSKQNVHLDLLQSMGEHVFERILEIAPPNLVDRIDILSAVLSNTDRVPDNTLTEKDIRTVALKTEGFQAGDIVALVDRALSHCELRLICPPQPMERTPSIRRLLGRTRLSTDSGDNPLLASISKTDAVESSPSLRKKRTMHDSIFSNTPQINRKISSALSCASASTLVDEQIQGSVRDPALGSLTSLGLILDDFLRALKGFVPASLRGLPLHSAGPVDFSNVGGLKQAKQTLRETLLWPSKYPKLFDQCPIKQRFGVLLYGAPGTGKTLLAGAVAKEFGLNFVSIKGPELLNKYIGASEQAVRDMFTRAQAAQPCILFFDEFDSLAPRRGHDSTGVTDRVVNQLLTQLDGVETLQGVYVLAATSRPDLIDPALLRPGRMDRNLFCDVPTQDERLEILQALSKKMPLENHADLQTIAKQTEAFTGADLKALLYNAQLQSAHEVLERRAHSSREAKTKTESESEFISQDISATPKKRKSAGDKPEKRVGKERKPLVFGYTDTGVKRQNEPLLESKVALLYNKPMRRRSTLTKTGAREALKAKQKLKPTITQQHLMHALGGVRPSVTPAERKKYDKIYEKFQGKVKVTLADMEEQRATMA